MLGRPPWEVWVCGKGVNVGWRNPSDKFFFFSSPDAGRASFLAAGGMGSLKELSPGKARAAAVCPMAALSSELAEESLRD